MCIFDFIGNRFHYMVTVVCETFKSILSANNSHQVVLNFSFSFIFLVQFVFAAFCALAAAKPSLLASPYIAAPSSVVYPAGKNKCFCETINILSHSIWIAFLTTIKILIFLCSVKDHCLSTNLQIVCRPSPLVLISSRLLSTACLLVSSRLLVTTCLFGTIVLCCSIVCFILLILAFSSNCLQCLQCTSSLQQLVVNMKRVKASINTIPMPNEAKSDILLFDFFIMITIKISSLQ